MNIPVKVRTHELNQMQTMVPNVIEQLKQAELDDAVADMSRIFDSYVRDVEVTYPQDDFAAYVSMPPEDWRLTVRHLNRARHDEGTIRVQYLQSKLVSRVEERLADIEDNDD